MDLSWFLALIPLCVDFIITSTEERRDPERHKIRSVAVESSPGSAEILFLNEINAARYRVAMLWGGAERTRSLSFHLQCFFVFRLICECFGSWFTHSTFFDKEETTHRPEVISGSNYSIHLFVTVHSASCWHGRIELLDLAGMR